MKTTLLLTAVLLFSSSLWAEDYEVKSWRCGAPVVEALRKKDPNNLLNDRRGDLKLKESLLKISDSNIANLTKTIGSLSAKEKSLYDLVVDKFHAPLVHRTSNVAAQIVLTTEAGLVSPKKRKAQANTPMVEEYLYSAHDCIFVSIGVPYGTERYGTTIIRVKPGELFGWATIRSGYYWVKSDLGLPTSVRITDQIRGQFADQVFTDNHWDKAMAFHIIANIRKGSSYYGQGKKYDKSTIMDELLSKTTSDEFWSKVNRHRLAYLEGKYMENVTSSDLDYVQFREVDRPLVGSWSLPSAWFGAGDDSFIQFFDRSL